MKRSFALWVFFAACAGLFLIGGVQWSRSVAAAEAGSMMLSHNVFFSLKESTAANREALVQECHRYLKNHPGVVFFAAGTLTEDLARPVNDRDFDVALNIVFKTRADHDRYQTAESHQVFIRENQQNWARVRVFDSDVR